MPQVRFHFDDENLRTTARALLGTPRFQAVRAERAPSDAALPAQHRLPATEAEAHDWLRARAVGAYQDFVDPTVLQTALPPPVDPFKGNGFFCTVFGPVAAVVSPVYGALPGTHPPRARPGERTRALPQVVVAEVSGPVPDDADHSVSVEFYTMLRG